MKRPAVEVAEILRAQGSHFLDRYRSGLDYQQLKAIRAIENCRTAAVGGHSDAFTRPSPITHAATGTVRNAKRRHANAKIEAREQELLDTRYFHVVFTVPHQLRVLALDNARLFYALLFTSSAQTMIEVAADPRHLGAQIGVISILHTWGQNLLLHPHVHCIVPGGGLSPDHTRWVHPRYRFFLPVKVLSRVFRGKFIAGLKRLRRRKKLRCAGPAAVLADDKQFAEMLREVHRRDWVVCAKPAFGDPMQVIRYLGRYTHRVAISNHRLSPSSFTHFMPHYLSRFTARPCSCANTSLASVGP